MECLRAVLPGRLVNRLGRPAGIRGEAAAPARVADVVRLYRHGRLGEIRGLGAQSVAIIGDCLVSLGLTACAWDGHQITPDCPLNCLLAVIPARVVNLLASAGGHHGHGITCGTAATAGEVIAMYRLDRLRQIPGLGAGAVTEIEDGLIAAGFSLHAGRD